MLRALHVNKELSLTLARPLFESERVARMSSRTFSLRPQARTHRLCKIPLLLTAATLFAFALHTSLSFRCHGL